MKIPFFLILRWFLYSLIAICAVWGAGHFYFEIPYYIKTIRYLRNSASEKVADTQQALNHVGIIMDGNRRWAKQQGLNPQCGHKKGCDPLRYSIELCLERSIPYLTVYAFSLENFKRSKEELDYLFGVIAKELVSTDLMKLYDRGVRVRFYGDRAQFPDQLVSLIAEVEEKTKNNTIMQLGILVCYGGLQEITAATKKIAADVASGKIAIENITDALFETYLWTAGLPSPDLIIRTGGAKRLSNFLVYKNAYSEILFVDDFWPAMSKERLGKILDEFNKVERRYGV